jgi:hypothetical protein
MRSKLEASMVSSSVITFFIGGSSSATGVSSSIQVSSSGAEP